MTRLFSHSLKNNLSRLRLFHFQVPGRFLAPLALFFLLLAVNVNCAAAQENTTFRAFTPIFTGILPYNFTLDFEEGNLRGWTAKGEAFATQPTLGDNPTARRRGQPSNHQGEYWIGTFENYQGRPGQRPGSVQGDGPQGILISAHFIIPRGQLSFLVGGGSSFETRVELLVQVNNDPEFGRERVYWTSGKNTETMHPVTWDLTPYAGKTGTIQIIDLSSSGWGHINADNFRFSAADAAVEPPGEAPPHRGTPVPSLIGKHREQAVGMIAEHKLSLGGIEEQVSGRQPGTVIAQNPPPNQIVDFGTPVYLVTAIPDMVSVPSLLHFNVEQTGNILAESSLQMGRVVQRQSDATPGTVIAQEPPAGSRVLAGSRINIVVALTRNIPVPRVIEMVRPEAVDILTGAGLTIGEIEKRRSAGNPDIVLDQHPTPQTLVKPGTAVSLLVSVPDLVAVPDLLHHTEEQAKYLLKDARLQLGRIVPRQSDERQGAIIAQKPEAYTMVKAGSRVDIAVAVSRDTAVPRVTDLPAAEAEAILKDHGLTVGPVTRQRSSAPTGTVLDQTPAPQTLVKPGSPVSLLVAVPELVAVPDLIDRMKNQADNLLRQKHLALGEIIPQPSTKPVDTIIYQQPQPESLVAPGTAVNIVIAVPMYIKVPDLTGMTREAAIDLIYSQKLKLGAMKDEPHAAPKGTVIAQQPSSGSQVAEGTPVNLVLAADKPVIVPDVVGMLRDEAQEYITDAELFVGSVSERSSEQPAGTVLEQWPAANQEVAKNSPVSLVIATEEKTAIPLGLYGIIAGSTLLVAGAAAYRFSRGKKKPDKKQGEKPRPEINVEPRYDPGQQTVQPDGPSNLADFEIILEAHPDSGTQSIEHQNSLIITKGKEDE